MSRVLGFLAVVAAILAPVACGSKAPPGATVPAHAVSAVVLVNGCAHLGKANARLAEAAINQLVDGCSAFSGASARFSAELLPGGAIQFEPQAGQSESVPICVLRHPLRHRVKLSAACTLDVRLEESTMDVPRTGDGGT